MRALPIRLRLTVWYLGVTALTAVLAFLSVDLGMRHVIHRSIDTQLTERTEEVRSFLWRHHELKRRHSDDTWADAFNRSSGVEPGQELYQLKDESGSWLYQSPAMQVLRIDAGSPNSEAAPQYISVRRHHSLLRVLSTSMSIAGKEYLVQVATVTTPFYTVLDVFEKVAALALATLVLLAGAGGYWLSSRAMRPVHDITAAARNISEHNLRERLPMSPAKDELSDLVLVLNNMLARLQAAFERIGRFTADASHELRTPVTVIRSAAEVMLTRHRTPGEYEEYGGLILQEAEFISGLIEDLLTLARTDADSAPLTLTLIPAASLAQEALDLIRPLAANRSLRLISTLEDHDCSITVDRTAWKRALLILLDNACKYTLPGGQVELLLTVDSANVIFTVRDTGIGIPEADLHSIFERFYRGTNTRGLDVNGSGLGLSLAQWIANAHSARLTINSRAGAGTEAAIVLPHSSGRQA